MAADLFGLLGKAKDLVLPFKDNYKRASEEIQDFISKVGEYEKKKEAWEQLLRKYPLPTEHPVVARLAEAVRGLEDQTKAVYAMEDRCCCLRSWDKAWSPEHLIADLTRVGTAFENIRKCLAERLEDERRLGEEAANSNKAPFSFATDEKYVPIVKTVEKVCKDLDGDGSSGSQKVVLLYGASGEGKSTLAKFLALDYYRKSKGASSSSGSRRFSDGVVFISCKEMTESDSLFLLQKLGADLGYSLEASAVRGAGSGGRDAAALRRIDLDNLKRKLISLLGGKSILIILDDVSDPYVIEDLIMQPEKSDVNYLITSQRSNIWSSDKIVRIGTPSTEEARKILANHIVGWNGNSFPPNIQGEVDALIEQVQNHPLVIANLASRIKSHNVSKLGKWVQLRKQLKNALEAAAQDQSVPNVTMMFNTTYKYSAVASLTMAFDHISDNARSLLLLLALCTGQGVPENVLALWFDALHGTGMFSFDNALEDLKACSLIMITETEVEWNICSIHDLRRLLAPEMYKDAVENILQELTKIVSERSMGGREGLVSSAGSDEYLVAGLFFLYCDEKFRPDLKKKLKFYCPSWDKGVFQKPVNASIAADWRKFLMAIGQLLQPSLGEACELWEKTSHEHAKTIIIHFLQSGNLEDYALSKLLEIPDSETFLTTCSALASMEFYLCAVFSYCKFPMTIERLTSALQKWVDEPPEVAKVTNLLNCLNTLYLCTDHSILEVVENLPIFFIKLLLWSSSNSLATLACTLLVYLEDLCFWKSCRVQIAATPGMLETLLGLLNSNSYLGQALLEQASKTFRMLACSDPYIKAKTISLPDVLNTLVRVLPLVPESTLESLKELSWTPKTADYIASHPGALDGIVRLLTCRKGSNARKKAFFCMKQLASFRSTRRIIASEYPSALWRMALAAAAVKLCTA